MNKTESLHWWQWCFGVVVPSLLLYSSFVAPTMEFSQDRFPASIDTMIRQLAAPTNDKTTTANPKITLLIEQHKKCGDEIKMRLEQEEVWFHYKFAFLGVMFAGYILRTVFREPRDNGHTEFLPPVLLREVFKHVSTLILLGTSCAVCIVADMHIRANRIIINEAGSWIAHVAEPLIFGTGDQRIVGWENFLRLSGGHHTDPFFHLLFWPEIFLVTVAVYAAYSYVFFWQIRGITTDNTAERRLEDRLRVGSYSALHVLLLFCALSTHYAPPNFRLHPWWWRGDSGLSPNFAILGYFALALTALASSGATWLATEKARKSAESLANDTSL